MDRDEAQVQLEFYSCMRALSDACSADEIDYYTGRAFDLIEACKPEAKSEPVKAKQLDQ